MNDFSQLCPLSCSRNRTSPFNDRPLQSTVVIDDESFLEWLHQKGFEMKDINEIRKDGGVPCGTASHVAAFEGSTRKLRWLASHGANLSLRAPSNGFTPFHFAMQSGSLACCIFLYKHDCGGDLDVRADDGTTPRDIAHNLGHLHIQRWLENLKRGEDFSATNPGQSPAESELNPRADYWWKLNTPKLTDAELLAMEKEKERTKAMSLAGLDSGSFTGFNKVKVESTDE